LNIHVKKILIKIQNNGINLLQPINSNPMAKKVVPPVKPEIKPEPIIEKVPAREQIMNNGADILSEVDKLIIKLQVAKKFAELNKRPAKHYFVFQQQLSLFAARFKKMLR
jgi:hypothetical protein